MKAEGANAKGLEERPESEGSDAEQGLQPEAAGKSKKQYVIDIFRDWCKSCGICAAFCPRECIGMNEEGDPVVEKPERCTGCGWCELHCPDFAISVRRRKIDSAEEEEID